MFNFVPIDVAVSGHSGSNHLNPDVCSARMIRFFIPNGRGTDAELSISRTFCFIVEQCGTQPDSISHGALLIFSARTCFDLLEW